MLEMAEAPRTIVELKRKTSQPLLPLHEKLMKNQHPWADAQKEDRVAIFKDWLKGNGFVEISQSSWDYNPLLIKTCYIHEHFSMEISVEENQENHSLLSCEMQLAAQMSSNPDFDFFNPQKFRNDCFEVQELNNQDFRFFDEKGLEYKSIKIVLKERDYPENSIEGINELLVVLSSLDSLADVLTHQTVHQLSHSPELEQLKEFSQWSCMLTRTPLAQRCALRVSYFSDGVLNQIQPSFRYAKEPITASKLEKINRWFEFCVKYEEGMPVPNPNLWFPIDGADGLPHSMVKELLNPHGFFEVLKKASPEQVAQWMGPSKPGCVHIPLEFVKRFSRPEHIDNFLKILDSKMERKNICWEHDGNNLLNLFVNRNTFLYRYRQSSNAHALAWETVMKIDPSLSCLLTHEEVFLGNKNKVNLRIERSQNQTVLVETEATYDQTEDNSPTAYSDQKFWKFGPIKNLEILQQFFAEMANQATENQVDENFNYDLSKFSESFLSNWLLEKKLLKSVSPVTPRAPQPSIISRF